MHSARGAESEPAFTVMQASDLARRRRSYTRTVKNVPAAATLITAAPASRLMDLVPTDNQPASPERMVESKQSQSCGESPRKGPEREREMSWSTEHARAGPILPSIHPSFRLIFRRNVTAAAHFHVGWKFMTQKSRPRFPLDSWWNSVKEGGEGSAHSEEGGRGRVGGR